MVNMHTFYKQKSGVTHFDSLKAWYVLNLNIDTSSDSSLHKSYIGLLNVLGLCQIVSEPTRITPTSTSILDHVIVSMKEKVIGSGVVGVGLSDHLVTYCAH